MFAVEFDEYPESIVPVSEELVTEAKPEARFLKASRRDVGIAS